MEYGVRADLLRGIMLVGCGELARGSATAHARHSRSTAPPHERAFSSPTFSLFLLKPRCDKGRWRVAWRPLAEALGLTATDLDRFWEAELYRLKGELTSSARNAKSKGKSQKAFKVQKVKTKKQKFQSLKSQILDPQSEAEACFLKAIEVAQQQEAKSLELRAAMSLARLWHHQGKHHEARNTLSDIYNWFTEGFDTKDLREAKALLEELRQ